jgi:protein-tyrosine-phosphatase
MDNRKIKSILFVCTGNSCRSVMAEGFLKKMLADSNKKDIEVFSAGTFAVDGFMPTENTVSVMNKEDIDVSIYQSSRLTPPMIQQADLILVMEPVHKEEVLNYVPTAEEKTHLLKAFTGKEDKLSGTSVPDPIGRPLEVYESVASVIKECVKELMERL